MPKYLVSRRDVVRGLGVAGAALLVEGQGRASVVGQDVEIRLTTISPRTFRLTILPVEGGKVTTQVPDDGTLVALPAGKSSVLSKAETIAAGGLKVKFTPDPLGFEISDAKGTVQHLKIDPATGVVSFPRGAGPILGMGEGGPQFDRKGQADRMISGSGGYNLRTFGSHVPVPFLIGTEGWAMYFHQPFGRFDFTGEEAKFQPASSAPQQRPPQQQGAGRGAGQQQQPPTPPPPPTPEELKKIVLPMDIFFMAAKEPSAILAEWMLLTGKPEMAPLWSFGYQQSHRTLLGREAILQECKTFREKKLPCDSMIYLGTGFCPAGWNTNNGEFTFNQKIMPDPKVMFDEMHKENFKVVLHVAYPVPGQLGGSREFKGTVNDPVEKLDHPEWKAASYWELHKPVLAQGVDGWWPDEGDALNLPSRLNRNRFYWDAYQKDRPNERPYALHRNGAAGMQRYAAFLWSGDVSSLWETLKNQVAIGINAGLSGIPYWGTDIGGFVPTQEFTGELYTRWFQFGAFCTLFRSHGRVWTLRLPWGWNMGAPTGDIANETRFTIPEAEYHNAAVEPVIKKYLELRYRMMPYLYSAVREATQTGVPVMRSLWLHYPDDPAAVARGDEYLWGRDVLVAPVFEKAATSRTLYLPKGQWYDFWTGEKHDGGKEVTKKVDLATMPLYVRAGGIVPMGPVKQYTGEKVDAPTEISVYPGADGRFLLYDDDGESFAFKKGEWMGIEMAWNDAKKSLTMNLAKGSKMMGAKHDFQVKMGGATKPISFTGRAVEVKF